MAKTTKRTTDNWPKIDATFWRGIMVGDRDHYSLGIDSRSTKGDRLHSVDDRGVELREPSTHAGQPVKLRLHPDFEVANSKMGETLIWHKTDKNEYPRTVAEAMQAHICVVDEAAHANH